MNDIQNNINHENIDATFLHLALSLADDYIGVFYVNIFDNSYVEYGVSGGKKELTVLSSGDDFFGDTISNCRRLVYPKDQEIFLKRFNKEVMLNALYAGESFTLNYRLVERGEPVYYNLKTIKSINDPQHVIIGIRNVDKEMKYQESLADSSATYNRIASALADRYEVIYYVDIETDAYNEYSSSEKYTQLKVGNHGDDFWADTQKNMKNSIFEEDYPMMSEAMRKARVLNRLERSAVFSITYRLKIGGSAEYVNLRAVQTEDKKHLVIAVSNIDESIKAEKEMREALGTAMEQANRDELTGVKSKRAYVNDINKLEDDVTVGVVTEYALGVFDVNNLKMINDTLGHNAGDEFIRDACHMICKTFKHSPIYRVGGDEFVAILKGHDYAIRDSLLDELKTQILENMDMGLVTLAGGIATYKASDGDTTTQVFNRADAEMYEHKKYLKTLE